MSGTGGKRFFLHLKIFLCIKQDRRKSVRTVITSQSEEMDTNGPVGAFCGSFGHFTVNEE